MAKADKSMKLTLAALPDIPEEPGTPEEAVDTLTKLVKWSVRTRSQLEELGSDLASQSTQNLALVNDGVEEAAAAFDKAILQVERLKTSLYDSLEQVRKALGKKLNLTVPRSARAGTDGSRTRTPKEEMQKIRTQVLSSLNSSGPMKKADLKDATGIDKDLSPIINFLKAQDLIRKVEGDRGDAKWGITAAGKKQLSA